jgi:hypothetical protein
MQCSAHAFLLAILVGATASCAGAVEGPRIDVSVTLSEAASRRLAELGEVIDVVIVFHGDDKAGYTGRGAPMRDVYLGDWRVRIKPGEIAHLRGVKFSSSKVYALDQGKYFLFTNVFTARTKHDHNLLDCHDGTDIEVIDRTAMQLKVTCDLLFR